MSVKVEPKQIIGPTLRLFLIATVTTILLALTNGITADKILQNQIQADIQSRQEVLPTADSFEEKTVTIDGTEITYYEASNGSGYVFSTSAKGYGGDVVVMTGIDSEGTITGVKITEHSETAGLGAKWATTDAARQFSGMTAPASGVFAVQKDGAEFEGWKLYREIGMVEEQHVTQYGSLMDTDQTWLEGLLNHQYAECFLYWSAMETEVDPRIKQVWAMLFEQEVSHLQFAADLLETYEGKEAAQVIPDGTFPDPLRLTGNIAYVRDILGGTVCNTALREDWTNVNDLSPSADFFRYQGIVNRDVNDVESHDIIEKVIRRDGEDYRFETAPNPVAALRDRRSDNTSIGRVQGTEC